MGDLFDVLPNIGSAAGAAAYIVADPALGQVAGLIEQLHNLQPQTSPGVPGPGVGLGDLIFPLQVYVAFKQNPIVIGSLVVGAIVGIPMFIGYMLGKK